MSRGPGEEGQELEYEEEEGAQEDFVRNSCMWIEYLDCVSTKNAEVVAPVTFFKKAPFAANWNEFARPGMVIELANGPDSEQNWLGKIIGYAGYKALVAYCPVPPTRINGFTPAPSTGTVRTWISFALDPKPMGYSFLENIPLSPPAELLPANSPDSLEVMVGATFQNLVFSPRGPPATISFQHNKLISQELDRTAQRFKLGEIVEALDYTDISRFRFGKILHQVGNRLFIKYLDEKMAPGKYNFLPHFWFNQLSPAVQKVGFCSSIGAPLYISPKHSLPQLPHLTSPQDLHLPSDPFDQIKIEPDMVFEMRHPNFPHEIVVGYVVKKLAHGYIQASTDWSKKDVLVETVLHVTSDYIQPVGFCRKHNIPLEPPDDSTCLASSSAAATTTPSASKKRKKGKADAEEEEEKKKKQDAFSWPLYLARENLKKLDNSVYSKTPNPFKVGCKLEAVMITNPSLMRPATVIKLAGRLMRLHFDGVADDDQSAFQWISCESSNIYPVGYAEMVGHKFKGKPAARLKIC